MKTSKDQQNKLLNCRTIPGVAVERVKCRKSVQLALHKFSFNSNVPMAFTCKANLSVMPQPQAAIEDFSFETSQV